MTKKNSKWKKFELLVHKIQSELSPAAKVQHNVKLMGRHSKAKRQIDILVEQNVGPQSIRVIVECKDYSKGRKVDIPEVESFAKKMEDVVAHKGVIVSATGFSAGAKALAKTNDIDLMEVVDAEHHEWQSLVGIPALGEFATVRKTKFAFAGAKDVLELKDIQLSKVELFDWKQDSFGNAIELFARQWNVDLLPSTEGEHKNVSLTPFAPLFVTTGGRKYEVYLYAQYDVEIQRFFGLLPILNAKGFWDVQKDVLHIRSDAELVTDWLSPDQINAWVRIENKQLENVKPVIVFTGKHKFTPDSISEIIAKIETKKVS